MTAVAEVPRAKLLDFVVLALEIHRPVLLRGHDLRTCAACRKRWPCPEWAGADLLLGMVAVR